MNSPLLKQNSSAGDAKITLVLNPLSSAFAQDPYSVYTELQAMQEPYYYADLDMLLLSRFSDVSEVALNPNMVRSLVGHRSPAQLSELQRKANWHEMPHHERFVQFSLLDSDGVTHQRLRKLVFGAFTGRSLASLEADIQCLIDDLLDACEAKQTIDFIEDFAAHIPGLVIGKLLGVPEADAPQLRLWSEQIVQFFDVDRSDEKKRIAETATHEFYDYLTSLKRSRKVAPRDDLISKMIADETQGCYAEDEFISTCMLILMAGHGSTIDVLGSGMHTLIQQTEAMSALRADQSLMPSAIQEMFRFESPLPFFHRHAIKDVTIRGQHYPAGTTFGLLYGAANRDPEAFDKPNDFNISRRPNRHLAFGRGVHLCLGNHLARLNMKLIFSSLLARFP
ncbi:MAG: cytochrome P450, partial [Arenicella sp.]